MRGGGGGAEGGMGEGGEVFCSMRFLALINHGGRGRPTAAMKPPRRVSEGGSLLPPPVDRRGPVDGDGSNGGEDKK
jgi:hypothetical protein